MGRIRSFRDCLELIMKSAEACSPGGGRKGRRWEGLALMESGGALLAFSLRGEKSRWWEGGRNDCFKLLQKVGVGGNKVTIRSNYFWLVREVEDGEPRH